MIHSTHPEIVKRLKRAEGHIRSIIEMIESRRSCLEIAQQMHAVTSALKSAKKAFVHDHIDNCLENVARPGTGVGKTALSEFKEITKYL
jgi:DNA-binding FrmR family transcriptional regulator